MRVRSDENGMIELAIFKEIGDPLTLMKGMEISNADLLELDPTLKIISEMPDSV